MKGLRILLALAVIGLCALVASYAVADDKDGGVTTDRSTVPGGFNGNLDYTGGPNVCGECHEEAFEDWMAHGHSGKLALAFELGFGAPVQDIDVGDRGAKTHARSMGIPLPTHDREEVYNWDNVLFVVGASKHWKTRFVGLDGYFLTTGGLNQYNWEVGEWVDYDADVVMKPFDCGACHTTGYDPDGTYFNDIGIPGVVGDFSHINITCEACHGPGAAHAAAPSPDNIISGDDISNEDCGSCHTRGDDPQVVLASTDSAGRSFIRHHEQWPELNNSPHSFFTCNQCHNGHIGRYEGIKISDTCEPCHGTQRNDYAGSAMDQAGVRCVDCHMGFATKSARANGPYEGDVWTHLFRINSDADYDMFNRDEMDNAVSAKDALSLEYACFRCHAAFDKATIAAIGDEGAAYHTLGK